ncbi:HNH endonuclease family protein [Chrysosporum ovalisporum CS-1034]|nr:HNH endonuclease family protein [Umezakia ovalisporum CS-1034]
MANLTLSGNNNKLGNKPFLEKRDLPGGYSNSRLWLNKYLSTIDKWGIKEIETRFNQISERVLKIWEYPKISIEEEIDKGEINIFEAEDPTFKKLEYAILFDQKIEVTQVSKLYAEVFKQLFERNPEIFFTTDLYQKINLTHTDAGVRQPVKISDTYFIEGNMDSLNKFERIKQALIAFDCEEELIIKYQP